MPYATWPRSPQQPRQTSSARLHTYAPGSAAGSAIPDLVGAWPVNNGRVTDVPPDEPFLVCYDYGMGGLWGVLMAPSDAAIKVKYPELFIANGPSPTALDGSRAV